ncbi:MAG: biotin--[acetyl-CoA-carboxylase] ligase [Planctomycetota bacterium]|nr:biotin--[acetyl-CoA-carboxylase] ligase [Planctomycetota bacterium]
MNPDNSLTPPLIPGHPVFHHATIDSTNRWARSQIEKGTLNHGAVVVTEEQTKGRGRRGRAWYTLPHQSLAMSLVLDASSLPRLSRLSILAAVSARRALCSLDVQDVRLKWPNDLMRGDRKIGGILVETAVCPNGERRHVLGLGINLTLDGASLPEDLKEIAGSAELSGGKAHRDALLAAFVAEMDRALSESGTEEDRERGEEYREASWLTGRRVTMEIDGKSISGIITDITGDGDPIIDGAMHRGEAVRLLQVEA